jgi:O-methyltransferase
VPACAGALAGKSLAPLMVPDDTVTQREKDAPEDRGIMLPIETENDVRRLYLDLLKRSLSGTSHTDFFELVDPRRRRSRWAYRPLKRVLDRSGYVLARRGDRARAEEGRALPLQAETMIGLRRLDNLEVCIEDVLANEVPGDFIETGVWRGGATIFMRAMLKLHRDADRTVWVADSFRGLPTPQPDDYPADEGDEHHKRLTLAVDREQVRTNFERYGLLDEQVRFLEGWFGDTLPGAPIDRLAIIRLDGDIYESTMDALGALYDRLSAGGHVIVDDYALPGCKAAVDDFRASRGIRDELTVVDWTGVSWRKSG